MRNTDPYFLIEKNDVYAKERDHLTGRFPVEREGNEEWLLNCANMISMARDTAPDTGTTDFAILQGQAPRHLDRNMSIFARVIYGAEWLNLMPRGDRNINSGVIEKAAARGVIVKATMGNQLAQNKQLPLLNKY
ncbi:MAG: peptidylprolyl isomerase [Rheinheimera sp.]|nr:peptidylprolyl isomerase [Rheinheimera sp.]